MTFRTYLTSRNLKDIKNIIKAEDLDVSVKTFTDSLGDDIIEVKGDRDQIEVLRQIFNMIH